GRHQDNQRPDNLLGRSRMKPEHRVRLRDQFRFESGELVDPGIEWHPRALRRAPRQLEVYPMVARLGIVQALKQVAQGSADDLRQGRETLTGARLDEGAAN